MRFINRQQGSGTRAYFDYLLAGQRLRPAQIAGYQDEEFTHAAVAATVASGMADAGFGIEAAARQQELDFVRSGRNATSSRRGGEPSGEGGTGVWRAAQSGVSGGCRNCRATTRPARAKS